MSPGRRAAALLAVASILMPAAAACSATLAIRQSPATRQPAAAVRTAPAQLLTGVAGAPVPAWNRATGTRAALSVSYISMGRPVPARFFRSATLNADGARPVIEILPRGTTLAAVAAGRLDGWLRQLAGQLTRPAVISFAPEADGTWYPWGGQPRRFIAAWRHVRAVIGTRRVTWMWQMSARPLGLPSTSRGYAGGVAAYWPGTAYVGWAGLDGYEEFPANTFGGLFGHVITSIRQLAPHVPVLLSETAVGPGTRRQAADVTELFAGIRRRHLLGVIWFDKTQHAPPYHQDWRLEDHPAALAAFRAAAGGAS